MKILIIEDNVLLLKAMTNLFTLPENKVFPAQNGMVALEMVEDNQKMDLIICDIMMPVVSGATFLLLFNHHPFKDTPIIVISSLKDGEEFLRKHNIEYTHFITKPFEISYLQKVVNELKKEN